MKKCFVFLFAFVLLGCNGPKLQEHQIDTLISDMRTAVEEKDAELLRAQFAADAQIEFVLPAQLGGGKQYDLDTYINDVAAGWRMGIDQTYKVEDLQIDIAEDGQTAVITDVVFEDAIVNGEVVMSSKTKEKIQLVMVEQEPKVKHLYAEMEMR